MKLRTRTWINRSSEAAGKVSPPSIDVRVWLDGSHRIDVALPTGVVEAQASELDMLITEWERAMR